MEQDARLLSAMQKMCDQKMPLNTLERKWQIANIPYMLQEKRYQELDEIYNQALQESFTSRQAEKRYFLSWTQMCNYFYDMNTLVDAGTEGLRLIKTWQQARPHSTHAWLAEAQYWNHRAWLYRSYGWANDTTHAMWLCAGACNEQMVIATLKAIDCDPRQWMAALLTSTNSKVFGQPAWLAAHLNGDSVAGIPLMIALKNYHRRSPQEVEALMAYSGLSFEHAICPVLPRPNILPEYDDDGGQKYWLSVCLTIFPHTFYPFVEYIPFRMPRWGGSHKEISELLDSVTCKHLSTEEHDYMDLLLWWDDYRDVSIEDIAPEEQQYAIDLAENIAQHAQFQECRHNALEWLLACYNKQNDHDKLWCCIQRAVMEDMKLNNYYTAYAIKFALSYYPDSFWIYNFICQNSQNTTYATPVIYRGFFQREGILGFEKDEGQGDAWLEKASDIKYNHNWRSAIKDLSWFDLSDYFIPLATIGKQRNIPAALNLVALEYLDKEDNTKLPYEPSTALEYFRRALKILQDDLNFHSSVSYPLVKNYGYSEHQQDLQNIYFSIAICYQALNKQEISKETRAIYEKNLLDNLFLAHEAGHEKAWGLFLLNFFEVKELSLAHLHLQQVQEEANKGTLEAMITLSRLYGNKEDEKLFNMKLSARWTHFAESLYPDNEIIADCLYHLHFSSLWKRCRYAWYTFRIPASELPGQVNSMV